MTATHIAHAHTAKHTHGPSCGHDGTIHLNHVDYLHEGTWEHEHEGHYDACTACECGCGAQCVVCSTEDCTCAFCVHSACSCEHCSDSCATCSCADCACSTCRHAA